MRPFGENEDRSLIERAKEGDMDAFESLVRKYQRNIYALCCHITGIHQTADDLSQETFIKAYFALPHFINGQNFYPWIRKIALHNCFSYLKKWKWEKPMPEGNNTDQKNILSSPFESPSEAFQREEMEQKFKEAIEILPPEQRIVFALRTFENMNYEEISQSLHIPVGTVMSRLNRARRRLKAEMAEYIRRS